jgi:uncharacterized membrane protein YkoI
MAGSARVMLIVAILAWSGAIMPLALAQATQDTSGDVSTDAGPEASDAIESATTGAEATADPAADAGSETAPANSSETLTNAPDTAVQNSVAGDGQLQAQTQPAEGEEAPAEQPAAPEEAQPPEQAAAGGEALSLDQIVGRVRQRSQGQIIDAALVERNGRQVYDIKVLEESGQVTVLSYDAVSGEPAS